MRLDVVLGSCIGVEATWTTVHLMHRALELGHEVRILEWRSLEVTHGRKLEAPGYVLRGEAPGREALAGGLRSGRLPRGWVDLCRGDVLLLRVNPLCSHSLAWALMAQAGGVRVVNDPTGIAMTRSKAWLASLEGVVTPPTLVTRSAGAARLFATNQPHGVVVKPDIGSGGHGVQRLSRRQLHYLDAALDGALAVGGHAVVQAYLPEAENGEKRLVWCDGEILGGYCRQRTAGEFRHNLKQGGRPEACEISPEDRALAASIGPHLAENGIRIAGLDVIGETLVEVNTLNPGGVHFAEQLSRQPSPDLSGRILNRLLSGPAREVQPA